VSLLINFKHNINLPQIASLLKFMWVFNRKLPKRKCKERMQKQQQVTSFSTNERPTLKNAESVDWQPSPHDGLLSFHDGTRHWYHCIRCSYYKERLYHAKMHFIRIHVKKGKPSPKKRAYQRKEKKVIINLQEKLNLPSSSVQNTKKPSLDSIEDNGNKKVDQTKDKSLIVDTQKNDKKEDEEGDGGAQKEAGNVLMKNKKKKNEESSDKTTTMDEGTYYDGIDWSGFINDQRDMTPSDTLLNEDPGESIAQLISTPTNVLEFEEGNKSNKKKGSVKINVSSNRNEFNAMRDNMMMQNSNDSMIFVFGEGLLNPLPETLTSCIFMNCKH
jgi:hypothetical protein